jgi:hypothetical protein
MLPMLSAAQPIGDIGVMSDRIDFIKRVHAALKLLQEKAPDDYRSITRYIGRIRSVERWELAGMSPYLDPPTFFLSRGTARLSVTWCAGAIAHDACHSRLWHEYKEKHNTMSVPPSVWTGQAVELKCIAYQIEVMERIGAPRAELDDLRAQDGLHFERKRELLRGTSLQY